MSLTLHVPESRDLKPRLSVFGVGGAGGNAVNNMITRNLEGVEFVVANTDAQSLTMSQAGSKVQLGEQLTEGLGAGAKPEIGARAAEESLEKITDLLMGSHMCFITAGMGGGTGTGAAPVIASAARQMGILTVGVVTKPFLFEGARRMKQAEAGIAELQQYVDTLIVIPNQNLFRIASEKTTFTEAFGLADDVLYQGVKGVTDLMVRPGMVNLDFADIRSVMDEMGKAMMGTGEAEGEDRATLAAERAIANPLLDEISLQGARGVLINITGGEDMTLHEVDEASNKIRNEVDPNANIIFGTTFDPDMTGSLRVSVVATGIDAEEASKPKKRTKTATSEVKDETNSERDLFGMEASSEPDIRKTVAEDEPVAETFATEDQFEVVNVDDQGELFGGHVETATSSVDAGSVDGGDATETQEDVEPASEEAMPLKLETASTNNESQEAALLEERKALMRERVREAAEATPVAAPTAETVPVEKAESNGRRFTLDTLVKRMSGQEDAPKSVAHASHEVEPSQRTRPESITPTRRAEQPNMMADGAPGPRIDDRENNRVDIPAFLRRKAN